MYHAPNKTKETLKENGTWRGAAEFEFLASYESRAIGSKDGAINSKDAV
jgi:hypothetical protein